jgi:aromatic amino acid aminotransferase I
VTPRADAIQARDPGDMLPLEPYVHPSSKETQLKPDLAIELNYSSTYGTPHFLTWVKEHIERVHSPRYSEWANLCTAGNTDGMDAVLRATLDRGDHLLVEEFGQYYQQVTKGPSGIRYMY